MTSERMQPAMVDRVYDLLSDRRRRHLLYLLLDGDRLPVDEIALRLAAWEGETPLPAVEDDRRRRIATALRHNHLPRLADHDVIEYDPDGETVAPGPDFDAVESVVRRASAIEIDANPADGTSSTWSNGFSD
ncbi:DUF7344 domain-containing protein [Halopiger aswanensis]|uniref:DUF7344 domain-containing protein n=1 Tax=Halopiger aswanensis TaxID=148449 RepID=A0A3R7DZF2_9EURY|nr:hypothetical protein [Halopiger aswanensis]RKD95259.1 hypothetical protein ATJ93_2111 [Halopiger aswanensis]